MQARLQPDHQGRPELTWRRYRLPGSAPAADADYCPAMVKVVSSAAEAVADIASGSTLSIGGFRLCGEPTGHLDRLAED